MSKKVIEKQAPIKTERKKGIKYIVCQHLKEDPLKDDDINLWAGDKLRFILCSICARVAMDTALGRANQYAIVQTAYKEARIKELDLAIQKINSEAKKTKNTKTSLWTKLFHK